MMKAIPTVYKGYRFRSRLEAKWAVFFDLVKWRWEYEPVDFNGWIPDFALYGDDIIYAEVKPILRLTKTVTDKIDRSGCDKEVLVAGQTNPILSDMIVQDSCLSCIGWLREGGYEINGGEYWWQESPYGIWTGSESEEKNQQKVIGFSVTGGSYSDRITGCYDGGTFIGNGGYRINWEDKISRLWAKAQNEVQWRPKAL